MRLLRPPRADIVLALAVVVLAVAAVLASAGFRADPSTLELVLVVISTAPLIGWRVAPITVLVITCGAMVTMAACGFEPAAGGLPPAFAAASASYFGGRRTAMLAGAVFSACGIAAILLVVSDPPQLIVPLAIALALAGMAVGIGDALRSLHARNDELERLRAAEARQAVAQERIRIARDVHDVVGHALAGIALQARASQRLLIRDHEAVLESLTMIDTLASRALAETRASIGAMREPGQRGELTPTPRLGDLPDLVAGLQQQDLAICLELAVDPATVPDALQTSVYRVVQEALSNVVRHAGSSRAEVVIRHRQGQLGVVVQDNGTTRASANHQGHGLRGMRERIAQHGGELRVGPRSEGGWLVHAEIPLALR